MNAPAENISAVNDPTETPRTPVSGGQRWKRAAVRLFFLVFVCVLTVDTAPAKTAWIRYGKSSVYPGLNQLGLWQGQWTLFAPKPRINNAWLSAEVYGPDGQQQAHWNSTYWANTSTWERFSGFRHINYNNRIQSQEKPAADDLADYLAKQLISPTAHRAVEQSASGDLETAPSPWRLVLSRSQLNLCLPDDGTLPTRDETLWISSSENLTVREYQP